MQFSDTTNKTGLIQTIEFYGNLGDGGVSGNATLLKIMTARINRGFDTLMPRLMSYANSLRWDDANNTDEPVGTLNIVSGQSDYTITQDGNGLDILNILGVKILAGASQTLYTDLRRLDSTDYRAEYAISPNSNQVGIPTHFLEKGNTVYLYPQPNYAINAGLKFFFEREQSYFVSTDTTKVPGIPKPFHEVLALYAVHDWLLVNKADNTTLISRVEKKIATHEFNLDRLITQRNPRSHKMMAVEINAN